MNYSFGNWIKRRRKALDLTQQQLAQYVGCSTSLILKIESDNRRPSRQIAELLAQHLEIPPDQHDLFLKVARYEKSVDALDSDKSISTPRPFGPTQDRPAPVPQPLKTNLPIPLTSLIGREHELGAIIKQIQNPGCRLLTLTGPGGIGKTRLALEAAHHLQDTFEHGAYFVSLAGTSSSEFIIPAVADALGYSFSGTVELQAQLFNFLKEKHILLVLDNLEHLLTGIELLEELLTHVYNVKLVTTSREQLNLHAEWAFELQGLPIPSDVEKIDLESNSAAALFIQRAKQTKQNFAPSNDELDSIKRICQLVEGSPLGLELAAAWVRMMSATEIASEIEHSVDFLSTAARDMPRRHRSIRAVFDHSWNLLSEEERHAMMQLSVFRSGFTREAAEQVAGVTLLGLSALVHKSLLRHTEASPGRYDFHELIRQYAVAKLQENPKEDVQAHDRHANYFGSWLYQHERQLESSQLHEVLTHMSLEIDNLRLAWDWMVVHRQTSNLQQSLASLFVLHDIRNWIRQGAALFEQAVMALQSQEKVDAQDHEHTIALGELVVCQGHMCWHLGELQKARDLLQQGLQLLGGHRERTMLAELLLYLSVLELSQGDYQTARRLAEECVSLNREQGRVAGTGYALSHLGMVCVAQGEYETAYACLKESVLAMRSIEHARGTAVTLTRLGAAALRLGRLAEAQQCLEESLEITRRFNDRWGHGIALHYLGLWAFAREDLERAESLIRDSVTLFAEDGDQILHASTLSDLGYILNERNAESDSWDAFRQALQIAMRIQATPVALHALVGIAILYAKEGATEQALELATYGWQHSSSDHQTKDRAERLRVELESHLVTEQIEAARSRAQSITLDSVAEKLATASNR